MTPRRDDLLDAAADHLAGDRTATTGPPGPGLAGLALLADEQECHRLDRIRRLLADGRTWERPSPAVLAAIVDRITKLARSGSSGTC